MASRGLLLFVSLLLLGFLGSSDGTILFSSLKKTLVVTAKPSTTQVLKAGIDNITITWGLNQTLLTGTDSAYKTIKAELCYAPVSQVDRAWRKTEDHLSKDKTCQFKIVNMPYTSTNKNQSYTWTIERDVPSATYFVRVYAFNADKHEVAYGQNTDTHKTENLFEIQAITGRHVSLDIASVCFSSFSVVALFVFFFIEKRKARLSERK
ncbi:high-affinity nitrate transporter 3.2 [Euphorbia lathyris]|uniref:high-affinity nitrate transporter 3.2 n=1 Tax=Euphorbia lathyris TaxID=212925 RepID=UPI003313ED05